MSSESEESITEEFAKFYEPTAEDLAKEIAEEDLITLCLRVPCQVNMFWYNIVDDYKQKFEKEGRLQNKNEKDALRLIMKGVQRHLKTRPLLYVSGVIQEEQKEKWRQQKKYNLLSLDLWKYQEAKAAAERQQLRDLPELSGTNDNAATIVAGFSEPVDSDLEVNWNDLNSQSITVNTESMPIHIDIESQQSDANAAQKNSDLFYEDFDCHNVPATSTQEQNIEMP